MTGNEAKRLALLHAGTPSVTVKDNRGLNIKTLQYHRHPQMPDSTDERMSVLHYSPAGFPSRMFSPRQFDLWRVDPSIKPERSVISALSGSAIKTDGADDGATVALSDVAGRPVMSVDARGIRRRYTYEANEGEGRLLTLSEQQNTEPPYTVERLIWAENTPHNKSYNLVGHCQMRFDTAGREEYLSVSLLGGTKRTFRQLLQDGAEPNWNSDCLAECETLLSAARFTTSQTTNTLGAMLTHTDARGNCQRQTFDRAGQLQAVWLEPSGLAEKPVVTALVYTAAGQLLQQTDGNGIITTNCYEPTTQRLITSRISRPSGHAAGAMILQEITYNYDPVGNILSAEDNAQPGSYWRNQKVSPEITYSYDTFYQLVGATGREMASLASSGRTLFPPSSHQTRASEAYVAYTRNYSYDRSNNLVRIQHNAPASGNTHSTLLTVSSRNNRSLPSVFTTDSTEVDRWFDAAGHQLALTPGQQLTWNARGELAHFLSVSRDAAPDEEWYRYSEDNQRLIKINQYRHGNNEHKKRVLYLSGLELRTTFSGENLIEELHVISASHVRLLHWETGKKDSLINDQLRYTYRNLTGSMTLEIDESGLLVSREEYYPYGGTAIWTARNESESDYKFRRYSGKERDATGLYYYGLRYYQPWVGRWLSADPAGIADGLNMFSMVHNNPINAVDRDGAATLFSQAISFIGGLVNNGFSLPTFSSFSMPSFSGLSLSGFSLGDISIMGILKNTLGWAIKYAYKKTYKALLNKLLSQADTAEQKRNIVRGFRAATLGISVAIAAASVATAGLAIPVAVGIGLAAGGVAAAIGFFAGPISNALSKLYARIMPARVAAHASGATGNLVSGGTLTSAVVTHAVVAGNDPVLTWQERSDQYRSAAGGEIGVAAGTTAAIYNNDVLVTGVSATATAMATWVAESQETLSGTGEIAAANAVQGAFAGRALASSIGLNALTDSAAQLMTGMLVSPMRAIEVGGAAAYGYGKTFLHIRTVDTSNFMAFRDIENNLPDPGEGWLSNLFPRSALSRESYA